MFLLGWELISRMGLISKLFTSRPSEILSAGLQLTADGIFWQHFWISMETLFSGLLLAACCGLFLGILIGASKKTYEFFRPFIFAANALPVVAVIPIIILWFGIGFFAKIFIVFFMAVIPILINTIDGVRNIDQKLIVMAKSLHASNFFMLKKIMFPGALPQSFTGLKSAVGRSIVALVLSEVFGYGKGLGYLISSYGAAFQTARLMFVLLILLAISLTLTKLLVIIEKRMLVYNKLN
jgi:NitT/TauT family transport system permease protein